MSQREHVSPGYPEKPRIRNRVRVLRRQHGISRRELADGVGLNYRTVGYIERQDYEPSLGLVYTMADYFGLAPYEVFYRLPEEDRERVRHETGPPRAVLEFTGGHERALILVILLDRGPMEKETLVRTANVAREALEEHLATLQSEGLVQTRDNEPAIFRKEQKKLFGLTSRCRSGLGEAFRAAEREDTANGCTGG